MKEILNSSSVNNNNQCQHNDKFDQLVDCSYDSIQIVLPAVGKTPPELICRDRTMTVVILTAQYRQKDYKTIDDVTSEIRHICAMKRYCGYPISLSGKRNNKDFHEFFIEYFCKVTDKEQNQCNKSCFNGGKCNDCRIELADPVKSTCGSCVCLHEPQLVFPNETLNRFCEHKVTSNQPTISAKGIIVSVVAILVTVMVSALIGVAVLYFFRRKKYTHYSNERLLSFPLEAELI